MKLYVLLLLLQFSMQAALSQTDYKISGWTTPTDYDSYPEMTVNVGDTLTFEWDGMWCH